MGQAISSVPRGEDSAPLVRHVYRDLDHEEGGERLKRLMDWVWILAANDEGAKAELRANPFGDIYIRVPVKERGVAVLPKTVVSCYGVLATEHRELLDLIVDLFAPTCAMLEHEEGFVSIYRTETGTGYIVLLFPTPSSLPDREDIVIACLGLTEALMKAGAPAAKVARLLPAGRISEHGQLDHEGRAQH